MREDMAASGSVSKEKKKKKEKDNIEDIEHERQKFMSYKKRLLVEFENFHALEHSGKMSGGKCLEHVIDCQLLVNKLVEKAVEELRCTNKMLNNYNFTEEILQRPARAQM